MEIYFVKSVGSLNRDNGEGGGGVPARENTGNFDKIQGKQQIMYAPVLNSPILNIKTLRY